MLPSTTVVACSLSAQVDKAAAKVTGVYKENDLYKATIKLTGFERAVLHKPQATGPRGPLENNMCFDRAGQVVDAAIEARAPEVRLWVYCIT